MTRRQFLEIIRTAGLLALLAALFGKAPKRMPLPRPARGLRGARARFMVKGRPVGYASAVTASEQISYEEVRAQGLLQCEERVPSRYAASIETPTFRVTSRQPGRWHRAPGRCYAVRVNGRVVGYADDHGDVRFDEAALASARPYDPYRYSVASA